MAGKGAFALSCPVVVVVVTSVSLDPGPAFVAAIAGDYELMSCVQIVHCPRWWIGARQFWREEKVALWIFLTPSSLANPLFDVMTTMIPFHSTTAAVVEQTKTREETFCARFESHPSWLACFPFSTPFNLVPAFPFTHALHLLTDHSRIHLRNTKCFVFEWQKEINDNRTTNDFRSRQCTENIPSGIAA